MKSNRCVAIIGILGATALPAAACHKAARPAESPEESTESTSESSGSGDGGAGSAGTESDAAPPAPLAAVLLTDTGAVQKLYAAATAAPPATPKPNAIGGKGIIARGIRAVAKKAAPGMQPDGPMETGTLKEKQHLQTEVTLLPGKCYALVGYSPKSKDLDLYLLTPPGILSGQDTTDDNKPVVGRAPDAMCPTATRAITYTVDIFADKGAGDLGVQLYSKDKGDK